MKKLVTEKDRLTTRCDDFASRNQSALGRVKEAKEVHELRVEVQRVKYERAKSAAFWSSYAGKKAGCGAKVIASGSGGIAG